MIRGLAAMLAWLRRFFDAEIRPALDGLSAPVRLVGLAGCALLMNKRYLADEAVVRDPLLRWRCLAVWTLATLWLLAANRRDRSWGRAGSLAAAGGGLLLALVLLPTQHGPLAPVPARVEAFLMLLLAWAVLAPAATGAVDFEARRLRPAWGGGLALLAVVGLLLARCRPFGILVNDPRYDLVNWGFLTCGWILVLPLVLGLGLDGGGWREAGGGLGRWRFWLPWVVALLALMTTVIVGYAGRQPAFTNFYPMCRQNWLDYSPRRHGWSFFLLYELSYVAYFFAWEFFFRGWLLFRLERTLGAAAIVVQVLPFVFMHIGKPPLEFHSSLLAGVVLGWLAWRGRSFWPCFLLHAGVAVTMDVTALVNGLRFAGRW